MSERERKNTTKWPRHFTQTELDSVSRSSYFQRILVEVLCSDKNLEELRNKLFPTSHQGLTHLHEDKGRVYDEVFHQREGYEPKVSRDDKAVNLTLNTSKEERCRQVPVLSSSMYGWRVDKPLEAPYKKNVRMQMINKGFFRSHGTCIPLETEMGELNEKCKPE